MRRHPHPLHGLSSGDTGKIVAADQAVHLIHDGDTVATGGISPRA